MLRSPEKKRESNDEKKKIEPFPFDMLQLHSNAFGHFFYVNHEYFPHKDDEPFDAHEKWPHTHTHIHEKKSYTYASLIR